jgi:hypothetical protein
MFLTVNDYIAAGLTHSLHNSEMASYRGCRRRWDWISRQMYYPQITVRPLEFGVAFHEAMEAYYGFYLGKQVNPDPAAATELAVMTFKKKCRAQRDNYMNVKGTLDDEAAADYKDRLDLGERMLRYYFGKVAPQADAGLTPKKVEIKFEVPIRNPDFDGTKQISGDGHLWCKCDNCWQRYLRWAKNNGYGQDTTCPCEGQVHLMAEQCRATWKGLPVTYGGRIDIIFEDLQGRIWIGDWKTAARISGDGQLSNDDFLWVESQITSYCWALWSLGLDIAGFIYAELKKAVPVEPDRLTRPYKGRWFSTNKQQATTYDTAFKTFEEYDNEGLEGGLYDDYLEHLQNFPVVFHKRHQVHRTPDELENFQRYLYAQAREMVDPQIAVYPNPGKFHCGSCAFFDPCTGKNRGEDYKLTLETMFDKRTRHYWEDAPATTDKRMEPAA